MSWDIEVGTNQPRAAVHRLLGGNGQSGIAPLAKSADILIFSTSAGKTYGYNYDGWQTDGAYHYTGDGQRGDQLLTSAGNAAILHHRSRPRSLRLFHETGRTKTNGKIVEYVGEFATDSARPYYRADAPDVDGLMRSVVVFRLLPVDRPSEMRATPASDTGEVKDIPIESHQTEAFVIQPKTGPTAAERREAALVQRYEKWLVAKGSKVCRKAIRISGTATHLYTDLFDLSAGELVEAKGTASRNDVRLALGQILDYARFVEHEKRAVLLPVHPGSDLADLLATYQVDCIYEVAGGEFERLSGHYEVTR